MPAGARVFVDAPVFLYHFTGLSSSCRSFLERCERAEIAGVTSVTGPTLRGVAACHLAQYLDAI